MKRIHHLWLNVYCKPEDNKEEIIEGLVKFFPFKLEDEKIRIGKDRVTIVDDRTMDIFHVHLEKQKHTNQFLKHLKSILTKEQKVTILNQIESRLDLENNFFIRFDKDKLIGKNEFFVTDKGNCYHLKMSIAAFPGTRENALEVVEKLFTSEAF